MLQWDLLLSDERRKEKNDQSGENTGTKGNRVEAERDYDRILFSSPTRRLADKTQVFPLDPSDSVRTRLTHSLEVSNLARSVGIALSFEYAEKVFGKEHGKLQVARRVPAILAATGLAHDLGNPPFGHQGEAAIRGWFAKCSNNYNVPDDFKNFDGNPHTFRLLTSLQILNDSFGLNLTYGTLAALIKYPKLHESAGGYRKFGIFESERKVIEDVWKVTGLSENIRHPLAHIIEACDDIAYAVLDAEDTVKKGFASFYDLMDYLDSSDDEVVRKVVEKSKEKNIVFKKDNLSSAELNDISMQMFRVFAVYQLITSITNCFVNSIDEILANEIPDNFELIDSSSGNQLCKYLKKFDKKYGYENKQVLELELEGNNYINSTMDMLWTSIIDESQSFSKFGWAIISENYKRAYNKSKMPNDYKRCQLLCDSVAGMTDSYLINIHNRLKPLFNGFS